MLIFVIMNIIFTDIDGVLNTVNRNDWNKTSIHLYNKLCKEFDLKAVSNYRGVWDKVDYHIENDPMCSREVKLRELLGEDFEEVLPIAHIEGSIDIISK